MRRLGSICLAATLLSACSNAAPREPATERSVDPVPAPAAGSPSAPTTTGVWEDWSGRSVTVRLETFRPAREFIVSVVVEGKVENTSPTFVAPFGPTQFDSSIAVLRGSKASRVVIAADDEVPDSVVHDLTETLVDGGFVPTSSVRTGPAVAKRAPEPDPPARVRPPRDPSLPRALPNLDRLRKRALPAAP